MKFRNFSIALKLLAFAFACIAASCGEPEDRSGDGTEAKNGGKTGKSDVAQPGSKDDKTPPAGNGKETPEEAAKKKEAAAVSAAEKSARDYFEAEKARDFGKIWDMSATVPRLMVVEISKGIAEKSDQAAKEMGFESSEEVKNLSDRDFFVKFRETLARKGRVVFPPEAAVKSVAVGPEEDIGKIIHLDMELKGRKVTIALEDGSTHEAAVVQEEGRWLIWEK